MRESTNLIEGRNAVLEAFRAGRTVEKLLVLKDCQDGPIQSILREAKKQDTVLQFVEKARLDQLSLTGKHQGVLAYVSAYHYGTVQEMLKDAQERQEDPFLLILDHLEDPQNLGAIIRTANVVGAHGVIIPKQRSVGLTATVAKASAGALNYTKVARVSNLTQVIKELQSEGLWIACAQMDGTAMDQCDLSGPLGLVLGNEGKGVSRLVRETCDMLVSIPMKGQISSLNASVAAGVLSYEVLRQRNQKGSLKGRS